MHPHITANAFLHTVKIPIRFSNNVVVPIYLANSSPIGLICKSYVAYC